MRVTLLMIAALTIASCSGKAKKKPGHVESASKTPDEIISVPGDDIMESDSESGGLSLLPETGTAMRFLDARALTKYYANVFSMKAFGYMHCEKDKPRSPADCTDSIFNRDERPSMGSFDLGTPRMNRAPANVNPAVNLTLNYTRTLRSALSRECISLVDSELAKLKAGTAASNFLIKSDKPTAADLDAFLKRILGLNGTTVALTFDAEGYAADFGAVVGASTDKTAAVRNGFIGLCIAISMDPLVFIY